MATDNKNKDREPIPWKWLAAGIVLAGLMVVLFLWAINGLVAQVEPQTAVAGQPTIIRLTAPPSPVLSPTSTRPLRTPQPTFTPIVTPDSAIAPEEVTINYYAVVANTDDLGLTIRGGPSTSNIVVLVAEEGTLMLVIDGPVEANGFNWWKLQLADGTEGWAVTNFLEPAAAPPP